MQKITVTVHRFCKFSLSQRCAQTWSASTVWSAEGWQSVLNKCLKKSKAIAKDKPDRYKLALW